MTDALVTYAINPESVAPSIAATAEVSRQFDAMSRSRVTDTMTVGMGFDVLRSAVGVMQRELDQHDRRIVDGLTADAQRLQDVVTRYADVDRRTGAGFDRLCRVGEPTR